MPQSEEKKFSLKYKLKYRYLQKKKKVFSYLSVLRLTWDMHDFIRFVFAKQVNGFFDLLNDHKTQVIVLKRGDQAIIWWAPIPK